MPPEKRNFFFRGFNRVYDRVRGGLCRADRRHGPAQRPDGARRRCVWSASPSGAWRGMPTAFLPTEDQGYVIVAVQLPDGASLERTDRRDGARSPSAALKYAGRRPRHRHRRHLAARQQRRRCANAGVVYVMLKDWSAPAADGEDLLHHLHERCRTSSRRRSEGAAGCVLLPPPIQGIGNAGGFQMQVLLTDGTFDYRQLQG